MQNTSFFLALFMCCASSVSAAEWETGMSRGLETYAATAKGGSLLLVCDPDRVYNPNVSYAHIRLSVSEDLDAARIVLLAATGEQAAFMVRDGITTQQEADPQAWSKMIDMIEAGGQIAVVTARASFSLELDPMPGFRCR